jgi:hypothetical protein
MNITKAQAEIERLHAENKRLRQALGEIVTGPEPIGEYMHGLHCGVEDRCISDRYDGAEYGFTQALEYCAFIATQALKGGAE